MDWHYFDLVLVAEEADVYRLVDEEGQALTEDGSVVLFASHEEASRYLRDHDIRGNIR